ncbi:MAG: arginine--tRNA ligase [Lachnospiraceae bacterium]|nr:arginine--tRNA ligase [Lachnospiraceae bacterium]
MNKVVSELKKVMEDAFESAGFDRSFGMISLSNRPDLAEYQCNGAMAAAKKYGVKPIDVATKAVEVIKSDADKCKMFDKIEAVMPGFINITLSPAYLSTYVDEMASLADFGVDKSGSGKTVIIDYGGANVAKPLHVGHLRSAVIGESIKRICRFYGDKVIGDVHLGDWGLQMGLVITELKHRQPDLVYFDENFEGEYPKEAPFTISELEEIYPCASGKSKEDEAYKAEALQATFDLQHGRKGYRALWNHIMSVSVADLKKNYGNLKVDFDLWLGESDADPEIPSMVEDLKKSGLAYLSDGALVVDVAREDDKKEMPPCMILKSDGAALYETTDLATILMRERDYKPDEILYITDKRQELHFERVFRCAKKAGIAAENTKLSWIGFGTMNGKDGKPFKTRDGGVMRLEDLIRQISDAVYDKMSDRDMTDEEARNISFKVGLAALKYGDLSNQASKDYVFDLDRFASFEGNTGPYIQYTVVRINSILNKAGISLDGAKIISTGSESEKALLLTLARLNENLAGVYEEKAPHRLCAYMYDLANAFNRFYHDNRIISEENETTKNSWLKLIKLTADVLTCCLDLLGVEVPERM